jgi:two-component system, chemotaxis family, CheB/CheR fusion protein
MAQKKSPPRKKPIKLKKEITFPVVGIGASAGGLEALEAFFSNMSSDSNITFVVIQHLSPHYKSIMSSLLKKNTNMKIRVIEDGMKVELNCVYLNPPNKNVDIINRSFQLMDINKPHAVNLPIDYFFRSLSADLGEKAICVILSGTGTDGTLGLKAIKGAGGMTMVQEEQQAKYNGMPRSAIDTGMVDYILPVEKIPDQLQKYVQHPYIDTPEKVGVTEKQFQSYIQKIFVMIRQTTGHDFSNYKQNTIRRRIERRLAVHQIGNVADYIRYIQQTPSEVETLFKDLLITVTNFFRDPESFDILQQKVIPDLLKPIETDSTLRIWVPGCATGEEAYSIAMLMIETMEKMKKHLKIQIFATDIDEDAIEFARAGAYPDSIAADVSPQRLKHFFVKEETIFRIKKQIREMVVFASQNLIKDPPFSRLHMVSCRNLLIYMDQVLQKKILPLFHYTLNQDGILLLGSSESIGEFSDIFSPIDTKWKIFKRKGITSTEEAHYPRIPFHEATVDFHKGDDKKNLYQTDLRELTNKLIIENYSPPCVLINEKFEILYFTGDTDKYLTLPIGEPSFNILKMARKELLYKLSSAINKAVKQKTDIIVKNLKIKHNNNYITTDIIVRVVSETMDKQGLMLVVFNERTPPKVSAKKKDVVSEQEENQRITVLEQELQSTKEYLQTTIEELETSNEELKSTNEELQSTNEELQSTNEELETSKEEMQSTNEELVTVNSELQNKVDELSQANNDINNLLASTDIGTIFLDMKLRIKRFTPAMTKIFNLISSDIERPISDITANICYENLFQDTKKVLDTLVKKEVEIKTKDGKWYSMRISPYRTIENVIDGVVITFVDIAEIKKVEMELRKTEQRVDLAVLHGGIILAQSDKNARYTWIRNPHPDFNPKLMIGKQDQEIDNNEGPRQLLHLKQQVLRDEVSLRRDITFSLSDGNHIYDVLAQPLKDPTGQVVGVTTCAMEITHRLQAEAKFISLFEVIPDDAFILDRDWKYTHVNRSSWEHTKLTKEKLIGKKITEVYPQIKKSQFWPAYKKTMDEKISSIVESEFEFETGEKGWYELRLRPIPDGILGISREITERKLFEEKYKKTVEDLKNKLEKSTKNKK